MQVYLEYMVSVLKYVIFEQGKEKWEDTRLEKPSSHFQSKPKYYFYFETVIIHFITLQHKFTTDQIKPWHYSVNIPIQTATIHLNNGYMHLYSFGTVIIIIIIGFFGNLSSLWMEQLQDKKGFKYTRLNK